MLILAEVPYQDDITHVWTMPDGRLVWTALRKGVLITDSLLNPVRFDGTAEGFDFDKYPIRNAYADRHGEIWIAVNRIGYICRINSQTGKFHVEKMKGEQDTADSSTPVFSICEDKHGNLWVHPVGGGLAWFDRAHDKLLPFYDEAGSPAST